MSAITVAWIVKFEQKRQSDGELIGDEILQSIAKHIINELDEELKAKQDKSKVKTQVYDRYSDDQDLVIQSFERRVKFCEESDKMIEKNEQQIDDEKDNYENELVMKKERKNV